MGNKKYKDEHLKEGLCIYCSRPAKPYFRYCEHHIETRRNSQQRYDAKYYKQNIKDRKCTSCKRPLIPDIDDGYRTCINCREALTITNRRNYVCS